MNTYLVESFWDWLGWRLGSRPSLGRYLVTPRHNAFVFRRELRRDIQRRLRYSIDQEFRKTRGTSQ